MNQGKNPFKSKRAWGRALLFGSVLFKLVPPELQQPFLDLWAYATERLTQEDWNVLIWGFWWMYGEAQAKTPIAWRFWEQWKKW
ncbi:MAG: hypothetical protein K9K66_04500 [Desulfarculaceae bacterium]|nr:hypothetical protein [Desulfarculaceae bacterium]MCF8073304.1 hypothetical protein [Desulfarculaceae bacterium]MCF8100900.1 hypothetical protein [Desulfarculaceae bacterium]MCF8116644.1 hypothetical protein [Desulfarculaceae bacterium]